MPRKMPRKKTRSTLGKRVFDARPDSTDFRDELFVPSLVRVPPLLPPDKYIEKGIPILDQGEEGACTGFALATVFHFLQNELQGAVEDIVSARMLYVMAKRYDEWPGEDYEGSSARGAIKAWHKHGVCTEKQWRSGKPARNERLTVTRAEDAATRPLGAYFRVNHKDLVAMHAALNETGILFATATVHAGWDKVKKDGVIKFDASVLGGHAFAIIGYDTDGFWLQNSWGEQWGKAGFAHLSYQDWLEHGMDAWVARLGVPVRVVERAVSTGRKRGQATARFATNDLRRHVISVGNDGLLSEAGQFGSSREDVKDIFNLHIPSVTIGWKKPRILLYAHGGMVGEDSALETVENSLLQLLDHEIYPIAFIWNTDFWSTLKNILKDAVSRRKAEGKILDAARDFLLDRLDDAIEPLARTLGGKALWNEMKENAVRASTLSNGGARITANYLAQLLDERNMPIHIAGHSAGAILLGPLAQLLATRGKIKTGAMKNKLGLDIPIHTAHLLAPACTMDFFDANYAQLIDTRVIRKCHLYTLTDHAEQDDEVARIYNKSVLYLVSNALEKRFRIPLIRPDGEALLGLEKHVKSHPELKKLIARKRVNHVLSPNSAPEKNCDAASATNHVDLDNDPAVRLSILHDILGECDITAGDLETSNANKVASKHRV